MTYLNNLQSLIDFDFNFLRCHALLEHFCSNIGQSLLHLGIIGFFSCSVALSGSGSGKASSLIVFLGQLRFDKTFTSLNKKNHNYKTLLNDVKIKL